MDFRTNPHIARVQEGTYSGRPVLILTPAGVQSGKRGDRSLRFVFDASSNTLTCESGKGSVSDACYGHYAALQEEARAAGITVVEV